MVRRFTCCLVLGLNFSLSSYAVESEKIRILEIEYCSKREDVPLNKDKIQQNMQSKQEEGYSSSLVDTDIENLFQTGDYANVQIVTSEMQAENGDRGVRLTVLVDPLAAVELVEWKRKRSDGSLDDQLSISRDKLKKLSIQPGELASGFKQGQSAIAMEALYRKAGYKDVKVGFHDEPALSGKDKVTFEIDEGRRGLIREVKFAGNKAVSSEALLADLLLRPEKWLGNKNITDCFDEELQALELTKLKELYLNKGYLDVTVMSRLQTIPGKASAPDDLILHYKIEEGQCYWVSKIGVEGNAFFTEKDILTTIRSVTEPPEIFDSVSLGMVKADPLRKGRPFSAHATEASIELIQNLYGKRGFPDVRVEWRMSPGEPKGALEITYTIIEGERTYCSQIVITGNVKTKDSILRREIDLQPGDIYDTGRIAASKKKLEKLGLFSSVVTYGEETDRPSSRKVIFEVVEKPAEVTIGLGVSFFWQGNQGASLQFHSFPMIYVLQFGKDWDVVLNRIRTAVLNQFEVWRQPSKRAETQKS